jgi:hypothetical protein
MDIEKYIQRKNPAKKPKFKLQFVDQMAGQ